MKFALRRNKVIKIACPTGHLIKFDGFTFQSYLDCMFYIRIFRTFTRYLYIHESVCICGRVFGCERVLVRVWER